MVSEENKKEFVLRSVFGKKLKVNSKIQKSVIIVKFVFVIILVVTSVF